jgi:DNA repair exonuclease SbcCD ATPase subunit
MTEEIINADGSRNWQANILLDNITRLEQERNDLQERLLTLADAYQETRNVCKRLEQENRKLRKANEISIEKVTVTAEAKRLQELKQENKDFEILAKSLYKRIEELEKENEALVFREMLYKADYEASEQENKEIYENGQTEITKLCNEKTKYRSALEEIRNDLKEVCKEECDYTKPKFCGDCDCRYGQILTRINEVLEC